MAAWSRSVSTATMPGTSPLRGRSPPLLGAAEQLFGAGPSGGSSFGSRKHLGQLPDPLRLVEPFHTGHGAAVALTLLDPEVRVGVGGNLAEVGHAQDLMRAGQEPQAPPDGLRSAYADPVIELLEDESGCAVRAGQDLLDGQGHSGELPARRDAGQRARWLTRVRGDHEYDRIDARGVECQSRAIDLHGRLATGIR